MGSDGDWQVWGERDPYFAVLSHEHFRRALLTTQALDDFFRTGRQELDETLADCRLHVGEIVTRRTLDFGCGVGRMLIPLAEISGQCVGVDISDAMRAEAARNCVRFGCANVSLVRSLDEPAAADAGFTFIHSYNVLQHIDPARGLGILAALLARLERGGCAALHLTFAHRRYRDRLGAQPLRRRWLQRIRQPLSRLSRRLRRRDPRMQMHAYDMNRVLFLAERHGIISGGFRFTDHAGHLGAILYLKRE